jgi:hypothetical protein
VSQHLVYLRNTVSHTRCRLLLDKLFLLAHWKSLHVNAVASLICELIRLGFLVIAPHEKHNFFFFTNLAYLGS